MSFDALAAHYRWLEFVLAGNKLQACRTAFLEDLPQPGRILILGEGNGRFLLNCRQQMPSAHITCVDASSRMLQSAKKRLSADGVSLQGIEFIHTNALHWQPCHDVYDLIVTHFFLDCFRPEQLAALIATVARAAASRAEWLLADFRVPARGWRRFRARIIHRMMYAFFRVVTRLPAESLACPDAFLMANGFALRARRLSEWGLLHTDRWSRGPAAQIEALEVAEKKGNGEG